MTTKVLNISKNAASRIKEILSDKINSDKIGLRISVKSGGCAGLTYDMSYIDTLNKEDEVVEDNGVKIFIDQKALIYLVGTVMDYKKDKFSSSFVFNCLLNSLSLNTRLPDVIVSIFSFSEMTAITLKFTFGS